MKKILILIVALMMLLLASCSLSDGTTPSTPEEHVHSWSEWISTKNATCESEGEEKRICQLDASHTETRPTEKIDHSWD